MSACMGIMKESEISLLRGREGGREGGERERREGGSKSSDVRTSNQLFLHSI